MRMLRQRPVVIHYNGSAARSIITRRAGAGDVQSRELLLRSVRIEGETAIVARSRPHLCCQGDERGNE